MSKEKIEKEKKEERMHRFHRNISGNEQEKNTDKDNEYNIKVSQVEMKYIEETYK